MISAFPIAAAVMNQSFFLLPILILVGVLVGVAVLMVILRRNQRPAAGPPLLTDDERNERYREQKDKLHEERSRILDMVVNEQITPEEGDRLLDAIERETSTMACPFCNEDIRIEAIKCKFCGRFLVERHHHRPQRLCLSRTPVIGGVCGGIADYLQLDPTLVRVLTIVVALFTSVIPLVIAYVIAGFIIPRPSA